MSKRTAAAKPKQQHPIRAVGYVRISVDRDEETSTETQEQRIRAHCASHGWTVVDVMVEKGRSAYKASAPSRPGLQRAQQMVEAGAANALIVWKLDRLARNTEQTLVLVRLLRDQGARFVSVTEQFDTATPSGKLMFTMLSALAEMESATKSDRTQEWQDRRRRTLAPPTGPRPFGYERGGKDNPNILTIKDDEADAIRAAAKSVLAGNSLRSVLRDLDSAGFAGKSGKPLTSRTLQGILLGPTIAACRETSPGVFVRSKQWKPILDQRTWNAVRKVLSDPERRTSPGNARRHLLSGIVRCSQCEDADGSPLKMLCKPHRAGQRYSCMSCHLSIEQARTDALIERALLERFDPKKWRQARQGRRSAADTSGFDEAMDELTARWKAGYIDGAELDTLADALRRQHETVSAPPKLPDVADLSKAWPKFSLEQRRLVLSTFTESLTILAARPGQRFDERRIAWVPAF